MNRIILAGAAGIVAVGAVSASAASLGGIASQEVGVDNAVVATCQTTQDAIEVDYTLAYEPSLSTAQLGSYKVATVDFTGFDATCNNLPYYLTLSGSGGTSLLDDSGTTSISSGAMSIDVSADNVDGEMVTGIALAIVGSTP